MKVKCKFCQFPFESDDVPKGGFKKGQLHILFASERKKFCSDQCTMSYNREFYKYAMSLQERKKI